MKTFKIKDDIVAAADEAQAIATWAEHFEEDPNTAGPCQKLDPKTHRVSYEQDDGSFKPGPLSDMLYEGMTPTVLIDGDDA